jgi:hypothetical protein
MFNKKNALSFSILLLTIAMCGSSFARSSDKDTVIVVPGRPATVALALDVARMRGDVSVVLYQQIPKSTALALHTWNLKKADWDKLSLDDYSAGRIQDASPKRIILIGTEPELMSVMERSSTWGQVTRLQTLVVVNVVNTLNDALNFSESEWRYLAKRYDLELKDLNAERRRYGRYGPPGEKVMPTLPKDSEVQTTTVTPTPVLPKAVEPPVVKTETAKPTAPTTQTAPEDK